MPLTGLVLYAVAYSLGMGPVPDIVPGEVFPTSVKGLAVSGVNVSLTLFTFLVSKIYTVSKLTCTCSARVESHVTQCLVETNPPS